MNKNRTVSKLGQTRKTRIARAQIGKNGYLVFHLLQGVEPRTVKLLGYSLQHKIWVRFLSTNQSRTATVHESALTAKAMIVDWTNNK